MADQPTVQIPTAAFARLVKVAQHVSVGRSFAFEGQGPYPDATARRALGELAELGLIPLAMMGQPATAPDPERESCAHCGKTIRLISGTLTEWWVHDPGGHTICFPEQAASSPRATPKPAAGVRQDGAQPCTECGHPKDTHREGDDPVTPGTCDACETDDPDEARHDYRAATS